MSLGKTKEPKKTVEDRIIEMVKEKLGIGSGQKVYRGSSFRDELGADSLDEVEIWMHAEDMFDIDITDDELGKVKTMGDFIDIIKTKVSDI